MGKKSVGAELGQAQPAIASEPPKPKDIMDDWDAKNDFEHLHKAMSIMGDPERMKKVHKLAGAHKKAIRSIQDLKDTYKAKFGGVGSSGPMSEGESDGSGQ